jgi:hypothetical protein
MATRLALVVVGKALVHEGHLALPYRRPARPPGWVAQAGDRGRPAVVDGFPVC